MKGFIETTTVNKKSELKDRTFIRVSTIEMVCADSGRGNIAVIAVRDGVYYSHEPLDEIVRKMEQAME